MDQLKRKQTSSKIIMREVWESNLDYELVLIHNAIDHYRFVSIDTEFPGTIFHLPSHIPKQAYSRLSPSDYYSLVKKNVDALNLIQLGLTLSDAYGDLPHFFTPFQYVWQFNFRDFDPNIHPNNPESISLLRRQGIDFDKNKKNGIDSRDFAAKFKAMLLNLNRILWHECPQRVTWITFQGSYDFAYLIKILIGSELPDDLKDFMRLVRFFFGTESYDLKTITKFLKIYGGLESVGTCLGLNRVVGKSHQAGSDSLLTMHAFMEVIKKYFGRFGGFSFSHRLYGLSSIVL